MNKWKVFRIGDISDSCLGKMLDKKKNKGEYQPYLSNKCVRWGSFDFDFLSEMKFEEHEHERYGLDAGDLIICEGGEPGRCAIWRKEIPKMKIQKALHRLRVNKGFSNEFLYYRFLHAGKTKGLDKYFIGSTIKHLTGISLKSIEFSFPSISEQKAIAKVLSDLDAKIELNNKINAELEAMAKLIYDYWFVQFEFPSTSSGNETLAEPVEAKPYKSSGGKMVYNEELKREIPEGWEDGVIGDYCESTGGFAFKSTWWSNQGVSVAKIKDIQEDYTLNLSELSKVDLIDKIIDDKFKADAGNILIAMTGATVGKYAIIPKTDYPIYVNQRVGYFNLGSKPTNRLPFLINSLNQKYFRQSIFTLASGAAQPNISNDQINNIQLIIPQKDIIDSYNNLLKSSYRTILNNQKQNQQLSSLRDWLLPMLMNGQVTSTGSATGDVAEEKVSELGMVAEPKAVYRKR